ncbi:MAG TPA: hypothetical protein VFX20_03860 [Steroidobacteraceae bacterium]|nr:hypothetical protein [Steroidobacteraceae bacterium]
MKIARFLTVLAASSLAGIAYAQTQPAPSTQPNAAPGYNKAKPHERQMTTVEGSNKATASPNERSAPGSALNTGQTQTQNATVRTAEAGQPGHSWSNMAVESPSGQSLGSVSQVVPGLNGQETSGYVVVAGSNGESVPVPYKTANSMVRDGKLILKPSRLEHAPKVTQEDMQNSSDHAWRAKADEYWMHKGHGPMQK